MLCTLKSPYKAGGLNGIVSIPLQVKCTFIYGSYKREEWSHDFRVDIKSDLVVHQKPITRGYFVRSDDNERIHCRIHRRRNKEKEKISKSL